MEKIIKLMEEIKSEIIPIKKEARLLRMPKYIEDILVKISNCSNMQEAHYYFSLIEEAKDIVAIVVSEDEIEVPDTLWKLYKDFDRIDDKEWREYLFNKIKNNDYSLAGKPALDDRLPSFH